MRYICDLPSTVSFPRRVALMGSTGSIGRNALRVMEGHGDRLRVEALAAGRNISLLAEQAARWRPPFLAVRDSDGPAGVAALAALLPSGYRPDILSGPEGFARLASLSSVDTVLSAQSGAAGLWATVAAAVAGKIICLANKESLVLAGPLLRDICAESGAVILPVDSEHYALFQCLAGRKAEEVSRLILTASGGPFRGKDAAFLARVTPKDALRHPKWNMGSKITIDSATLMNKGLEIIEACHLYGMEQEEVEVLVHPQSLVHSLVLFRDGSMLGQIAEPDMRLPIAACLNWPHMPLAGDSGICLPDLAKAGTLTFEPPDEEHFPCLGLARQALRLDRTVELNAANEVAVRRFLDGELRFTDIPRLVGAVLDQTATAGVMESRSGEQPDNVGEPVSVVAALVADIEKRDTTGRELAERWQS